MYKILRIINQENYNIKALNPAIDGICGGRVDHWWTATPSFGILNLIYICNNSRKVENDKHKKKKRERR